MTTPQPLHPPPHGDADPADLASVSSGAEALARLPDGTAVPMLEAMVESLTERKGRLRARAERTDRLRWWPEDSIDADVGERLGARTLAAVPTDPPADLLFGRLDPLGHTCLYGTGGSGKGALCTHWIHELVAGGHRILIIDYENHPEEWSRRLYGLGGDLDRGRVLHVAPLTVRWTGRRGPIWVQADELRQLAQAWGATYVFVDSIVPACGGTDPLKPEAAGQYAGALELIGLPVCSLAHVTKSEQLQYPFGSVFWHNLARVTWSLQVDGARALLVNRKANNYSRGGRFMVEITWRDGLPVEVWERPYAAVMAERIGDVLAAGALPIPAIVRALNESLEEGEVEVKADTIRAALRRGAKGEHRRFDVADDRWSNAS